MENLIKVRCWDVPKEMEIIKEMTLEELIASPWQCKKDDIAYYLLNKVREERNLRALPYSEFTRGY